MSKDHRQYADAQFAAREWIKIAKDLPREAILDESWMISWFANVSMAGYDIANDNYSKTRQWLRSHNSFARIVGEMTYDDIIVLTLDVMSVERNLSEQIVTLLDKGIDNLTNDDKSKLQDLVAQYKATASNLLKE